MSPRILILIAIVLLSTIPDRAQSQPGLLNEGRCQILVVGDSIALSLSQSLGELARQDGIDIESAAKENTGLSRFDAEVPFDWLKRIQTVMQRRENSGKGPYGGAMIMIGGNDGQSMIGTDDRGRRVNIPYGTPDFFSAYTQRARDLVQPILRTGAPVLWVSMPRTGIRSHNSKMEQLNGIYEQVSRELGAQFYDLYSKTTPFDPSSRTSDLIHFSRSGNRQIRGEIYRELKSISKCSSVSQSGDHMTQLLVHYMRKEGK